MARTLAVPGALLQMAVATCLGAVLFRILERQTRAPVTEGRAANAPSLPVAGCATITNRGAVLANIGGACHNEPAVVRGCYNCDGHP
jgi:predicted Kef-type K+ transport protein